MDYQEILDRLENKILQVGGEIRIHGMMRPNCKGDMQTAENLLGECIADVLALKTALGATSMLSIVESENAPMSEQDAAAWDEDAKDIERIKREWYAYRHEGDETPPTSPRQLS